MVDGDESSYYIVGNTVVSRVSKSTLTASLSKTYGGAQIRSAWITGGSFVFIDSNAKVVVTDKSTLEVTSSFTLPSDAVIGINSARPFAQTRDVFAWVGGTSGAISFVYTLDKSTLDVNRHTLSWATGNTRYAHMFVCAERPCIATHEASTPGQGRVHQYTATQMIDLFSISGNGWSAQSADTSGCWHSENLLSLTGGGTSPQELYGVNTSVVEWSLNLREIPNPLNIPSLQNIAFTYQNSAVTNLTAVTKTNVTTTASNGTNSYTAFVRFPYRTFY
jgi:hypothetical protein